MAMTPKRVAPYNFSPGFECAVISLACSKPRFYGRIAHELDPDMLNNAACKLALKAAHAINTDTGHGPSSTVLVIQRLRAWMADGKVAFEAISAVNDVFDDAEDAGLIDEEGIIAELAPMLSLRIRDDAVQSAIESYAKHGDLAKVVAMESRAVRMGQVDTSVGTILGSDSFSEIQKLRELERLKTGVVELDSVLDGGLQRAGLGVIIGGSGDGKSMMLSHISGVSILGGLHVAYATLELPVAVVLARIKSNLTGIPINTILGPERGVAECKERLAKMAPRLGRCVVQEFPPQATTVEDLKDWVRRVEEQAGRAIDLLVVDYADKLTAKVKRGEKDSSEYTMGLLVYEGLRTYSAERKMFCWTASQSTRQKDRKKKLDLNDVADSMHKIRVADLVITLNLEDDGENPQITFNVAKHRTGRSRVTVGPLPAEYECGRVCSVVLDQDGFA